MNAAKRLSAFLRLMPGGLPRETKNFSCLAESIRAPKVLDGLVVCTPFTDDRGRGYEMSMSGSYGGLLGFRVR